MLNLEGHSNLFIVEGKDEKNVIEAFLDRFGNVETPYRIHSTDGIDNMGNFLRLLPRLPGFEELRSIGIVADADNDCNNRFKSIVSFLESVNLEAPHAPGIVTSSIPKIGVFIMPNNKDNGCLEDLFVLTVSNTPIYSCISSFFECAAEKGFIPRRRSKAFSQAVLSCNQEFVKDLGVGAKKGYWDFNHNSFKAFREFILTVVE